MTRERFLLAATVTVGAAVRLWNPGAESFWHDEAWTWGVIQGGPRELLYRLARFDAHPPLYFLLLQGWSLAGSSEAWLRLPSCFLGIATIPLLYRWVSRLADVRAALLAALFLAISPYHIAYSREARSYALLFFLCLLSLNLLFDLRGASDRRRIAAFALVTAAIMLTHYMGAFFILSEIAAVALLRRDRPGLLRDVALAWTGAFALFVPWLPVFFRHVFAIGEHFWIPPLTGRLFIYSMCELVVNPGVVSRFGHFLSLPLYAGALAVPFLARRREHVVLLVLVLVPIAGQVLVSLGRPVFYTQTFQYVLAPLLALAAIGLSGLPIRAFWAHGLAIALPFAVGLIHLHRVPRKEDWREAVARVEQSIMPGERVVLQPGHVGINVSYYLRHDPSARCRPALRPVGDSDMFHEPLGHEAVIREVRSEASGVWLLFRYGQDGGWGAALGDLFERDATFSSRGVDAHHFRRRWRKE